MLTKEQVELLNKREFVSLATCNFSGRPNAAPKFLLKADEEHVYIVDYTISTTYQNLKLNPRVSISFIDARTLTGYQLNGAVAIIEKGPVFDQMHKDLIDKEIRLTAQHLIEDVRGGQKHDAYEVEITEKVVIFEVKVDEIVEIGTKGELKRRKKGQ
jgi:predicted pyridoxine 5'-phosphate oxidase superfamily flavin-nucleotide-binding protein